MADEIKVFKKFDLIVEEPSSLLILEVLVSSLPNDLNKSVGRNDINVMSQLFQITQALNVTGKELLGVVVLDDFEQTEINLSYSLETKLPISNELFKITCKYGMIASTTSVIQP